MNLCCLIFLKKYYQICEKKFTNCYPKACADYFCIYVYLYVALYPRCRPGTPASGVPAGHTAGLPAVGAPSVPVRTCLNICTLKAALPLLWNLSLPSEFAKIFTRIAILVWAFILPRYSVLKGAPCVWMCAILYVYIF